MAKFLVFYAPFIVVILSVILSFWVATKTAWLDEE